MVSLVLVPLLVLLLNTCWAALLLLGLPGVWLMIVTAGVADWLTPDRALFHPLVLGAAVLIAIVGEGLEILASAKGAKQAGASKRGAWGALIGGLLGGVVGTIMIPIPVVGTLIGGAAGAFTGSAILEHEGGAEARAALRVGGGAAAGHLVGMLAKFGSALAVWALLAVAAFMP
ncbi:MAG TPA: DUF456 domain-containing protein [Planctomycetes bacterium]|nr:DUF456 domain-containing protein [Planctomycetota bacterium]HIK60489.1 DUF456 domain-containing protein [Planctomycetota bacterium]